jgi:hypothetical protein
MSNHDPANRRRRHQLNSLPLKLLRNRAPECLSALGKLKHERTLQIDRAMQTAGELKVAIQQRASRSELIDHLFSVHVLTSRVLQSLTNAALFEFSF